METWYVNAAAGVVGPVDSDFVKTELREGRLTRESLVCRVGEQSWRALGTINELVEDAGAAVPAIAPPPPPPGPQPSKSGFGRFARKWPMPLRIAVGVLGVFALIDGVREMRSGVTELKSGTTTTSTPVLPECASTSVTQAAKQAIETTMAQKNMPLVATITKPSEVRQRPEPAIRVCVAALDTRLGHETLYYSVQWQQQGAQTVPWVQIIGNADDGR